MINETNITKQNISLTDEELEILKDYFGNETINLSKAEVFNERVVLRYEIGEYWIEYTYDGNSYEEIEKEVLENDRIKWLKDLANILSDREEIEPEPIEIDKNDTTFSLG